jgi:hypothetical protein
MEGAAGRVMRTIEAGALAVRGGFGTARTITKEENEDETH